MSKFWHKIWPWSSNDKIYTNTPIWFGFGSNTFNFNKIYTTKQDNDLLVQYFNQVAEVAAPILKYVDGAKQIKITTENPELQKIVGKPNYYQTFNEIFATYILYKMLFGESVINALSARTFKNGIRPVSLYNITSQFMGIETTQGKNDQNKDFRTNEIVKYLFKQDFEGTSTLRIDPNEILHIKESHPNFIDEQYLFGESRLAGCYQAIQSITEGYSAKTNLYSNGPRLIITGKTQGEFAAAAESEDIEIIQKRMEKYGWSKDKYNNLVTDKALDVFNASLNVAQLQINENNTADFDKICNAYGMDSKIFSYYKGSTFANKEQALKDFYNNAFKSEIDQDVEALNEFFSRWFENPGLTPDYSSISEIVDAQIEENERLFKDVERGLMTRNQYLENTGQELVLLDEYNKYYYFANNQWISLEPDEESPDESTGFTQEQLAAQANLRGSVGGVQGILALQAGVSQGITSVSAGLATLMEIYGFDLATATAILGTPSEESKEYQQVLVIKLVKKYGINEIDTYKILKIDHDKTT